MSSVKRVFIVEDMKQFSDRFILSGIRKQVKGFIRLGHDVHRFDYGQALRSVAPVKSAILSRKHCKSQVDDLLITQIKRYSPDIVFVSFAKYLDVATIQMMREAAPNAVFFGCDGDPWPQYQKNRIEIASKLDLMLATNNGKWLDLYTETGVQGAFMPNPCDPDLEFRQAVSEKWKADVLFTGKTKESRKYPTDPMRGRIIHQMQEKGIGTFHGCLGFPKISGIDYQRAISGARIALSINAVNDVSMYHSDRITHYLASGAFVLAKRVPDSDLLFQDGVHVKYFDTQEEYFELIDWYLKHEKERRKIADAGMQRMHQEFNGTKIAEYTLDLIETGRYKASWTV